MAKKVKNAKLIKSDNSKQNVNNKMTFNNFARKVQLAKEKKIQKMGDTKNRLISNKRNNKVIRLPNNKSLKKINKFSLLDNQDNEGKQQGLTHKGKSFKQIKNFNDMNFQEDEFSDLIQHQQQLNFDGFQENNQQRENKPKTKNEIYKQIIEKSKQHKKDRQQQYEQNFNTAVQLDEDFPNIVSKLKFKTQSSKLRDKIANKSLKQNQEYEKLINELRQDQRVVAVKSIENVAKGSQKIKKKKNQQINLLMKNNNYQDQQDIRGWVNNISQQQSQQQDQIDDVQLSSGDQDDEDQSQQDQQNSQDGDYDQQQEDDIDLDQDQQQLQFQQQQEQSENDENKLLQIVQESSQSNSPVKKIKKLKKKKKKY